MKSKIKENIMKLKESFFFVSIYNGFALIIPVILTGVTACALMNLPIPAYQQLLKEEWVWLYNILNVIYQGTYGCFSVALTVALGAGYGLEKNAKPEKLAMYILMSLAAYGTQLGIADGTLNMDILGTKGCFSAVFSAVIACRLYDAVSKWKRLSTMQQTVGMEPACARAINAIIPMFVITTGFSLLNLLVNILFGVDNVQGIVYKGLILVFTHIHSEFFFGFLYTVLVHFLWFIGFHGSNMMEVVVANCFASVGENVIFSKSSFDVFVVMGGCGTSVCLLLLGLIFYKRKRFGSIARLSAFTVIFNANEMLNFGIPIIFNPVLMVPFILTPVAAYVISYIALYSGIVPPVTTTVYWTTPVLFSGYLATGSIKGSILQLFIILVGMAIYYPFVKVNERLQAVHVKHQMEKLLSELKEKEEECEPPDFVNRSDSVGMVARMLLRDLRVAVKKKRLYMLFQPQMDADGKCIGAEALIRWKHPDYGFIYPPLIIYLAKEGKVLEELEKQILDMTCQGIVKVSEKYSGTFKISMNITAKSLNWDIEEYIKQCEGQYKIEPKQLWIEITEQDMLTNTENTINKLEALKADGHTLLIDDFGMGHTSIMYLQSNYFGVVKLDGSLIRNLLDSDTDQKIVASVIELGEKLGVKVIAEFVETKEQRDLLKSLGCTWYQGYLYSKPISIDEFLEWIVKCNGTE